MTHRPRPWPASGGAAAQLCADVLLACDEVRVLATSREPLRVGLWFNLFNGLSICGQLCVATGRYAEAITVWAPLTALAQQEAGADTFAFEDRRAASLGKARQVLGADRARAAHERGAGMSLVTIAEYALMLAASAWVIWPLSIHPPGMRPGPARHA